MGEKMNIILLLMLLLVGITGLFGGDWGIEKDRSKGIESMLKEICENKGWDLIEAK